MGYLERTSNGISAVYGTVALIGVVIVLASLIFMFASGLGTPTEHTADVTITETGVTASELDNPDEEPDAVPIHVDITQFGNADTLYIRSGGEEIVVDREDGVDTNASTMPVLDSSDDHVLFESGETVQVISAFDSGEEQLIASYEPRLVVIPTPGGGNVASCEDHYASNPGDGTQSNPYQVSNVQELQCINYEDYRHDHHVLTADIDAAPTEDTEWKEFVGFEEMDGSGEGGFYPLGSASDPFTGSLDGNGHTITGLYIERPTTNNVGLFGVMGSEADVTHLTLADATVRGNEQVGALVGETRGSISDAHVTGETYVSARQQYAGGVIGRISNDAMSSPSERKIHSISAEVDRVVGASVVGGVVGEPGKDNRVENFTFNGGSVIGVYAIGGASGGYGQVPGDGESTTEFHDLTVQNATVRGIIGDGSESQYTFSDDQLGNSAYADRRGGLIGGLLGSNKGHSSIHGATVENSSIEGQRWVGGAIGWAGDPTMGSGDTVELTDITVNDSEVTAKGETWDNVVADRGVGGITSYMPNGTLTNVSGSNITVNAEAGEYHGGIIGTLGSDATFESNGTITGTLNTYQHPDSHGTIDACIGEEKGTATYSCDFTVNVSG